MAEPFIVADLALYVSDDGESFAIEAKNPEGESLRLSALTENAPTLAVALLQNFQGQIQRLPGPRLHEILRKQEQIQLHAPLLAQKARAVTARGADEAAILMHLGGTLLQFRLPMEAVRDLRDQLDEILGD